MEVVFWGTRGSLPRPMRSSDIREKVERALKELLGSEVRTEGELAPLVDRLAFQVAATFGGNTSCVEVRGGDEMLVLDAGTGIRDLASHLSATGRTSPLTVHLLMSHLHWDHIQGFPFFTPAYVPGNQIHLYGFHEGLEESFVKQQEAPFFPVPLDAMAASIHFHRLELGHPAEIAGFEVTGFLQHHPGDSYGYALDRNGRKIVYSTDSEHYDDAYEDGYPFVDFIRDADVLIFDAAYTMATELLSKRDWGHSNNLMGVELAARAGVRRLCLVHHDHVVTDEQLAEILEKTRRYVKLYETEEPLRVDVAYDGMVVEL